MSNTLFSKTKSNLFFLTNIIGLSLLTPILFTLITLGIAYTFPNFVLDSTFLTIFFLIACTLYNTFIIITIGLNRGQICDGENMGHFFSILVPAHNEENVIDDTLSHLFQLDYPSELFEVIVINDGSADNTEYIVKNFQKNHQNLMLINIPQNNGGKGKSAALNTAFADFLLTWRGIEIRPRHRWIIGVFDADAFPDPDMLKKVSFQFNDLNVGGVQTLVRIKNRNRSFLAKLQDIEFVSFSRVAQFARNIFKGSVALGGNGQFIRAISLDSVALKDQEEYWKEDALTEDLDIGIRLIIKNWENRYIDSCCVQQEGVESLRTMFYQRERWAWGHIQTLSRYVPRKRLWTSKTLLKTKLDTALYLSYIMVPAFVLLCWIWSGLNVLGIIPIHNMFPNIFTLGISFSFFPLLGFGLWKARDEYPVWQIIPLILITTVYTYHWIPCIASAIVKALLKKPNWKKTPHFNNQNKLIKTPEPSPEIIKPQETIAS